jgi:ribosome maturation factor RimP
MSRNPLHQRLISVVEPVCNAAGFDLVELRFVLEQAGWVLRVCVDLPLDASVALGEVPLDRVDLSDCEALSRELSAVLDVDDPIPQAYSLEVSSPGIERPLRTVDHFSHFTGSEAKVQLAIGLITPSGERRNFRGILGGVVGEHGDRIAITCDGQAFELPIADIDHAKLVPDWDAVMKGGSGFGAPQPAGKKKGARPGKHRKHHDHPATPAPEADADKTNT